MLEFFALGSVGLWGWKQGNDWLSYVFGFGIPIVLAIVWGTFAVPDDPSRSGSAPVVTPGFIRLAIELAIFALATWTLYDLKFNKLSLVFGIIVLLHYAVSYDRINWLMSQ